MAETPRGELQRLWGVVSVSHRNGSVVVRDSDAGEQRVQMSRLRGGEDVRQGGPPLQG